MEADAAIWRAATKTVTAYHKDIPAETNRRGGTVCKTVPKTNHLKIGALKSTEKIDPKGKVLSIERKPFTLPADFRKGNYAGIDSSNARRLRKGRAEIEDIIDLHGMTQAEALVNLRQFIQQAALAGKRTILVITGKGRAGKGVLRARVPEWLKEPPLCQLVIAISNARPTDGGTGALYVRLKRRARQ